MKIRSLNTLIASALIVSLIQVKAINVTLDPSSDKIVAKDETITFTPTVTHSQGKVTYKWDFGGDGATPPSSSSSSAVPVSFSKLGKDYNVKLTVTDSLKGPDGPACAMATAKVKITLPTISATFKADPAGPGTVNYIPAGVKFADGSLKVKTLAQLSTAPAAPTHDFGTITPSDAKGTTLDPTKFTSDAKGNGSITVISNSGVNALTLTIQKQTTDPHSMLPAQFVDTFRVTFFTTLNEGDFSGPTVSDTTQRAAGENPPRFYYIHSNVPAKSDFLGQLAIEGYGYTVNKVLLKPISTHRIAAPHPLPPQTNSNYVFDDMTIGQTTGVPLGNHDNPLIDKVSAAVQGPIPAEIPPGATFNFGDGVRTADDSGPDIGDRHIDAYVITANKNLPATIQAATVTLNTTP